MKNLFVFLLLLFATVLSVDAKAFVPILKPKAVPVVSLKSDKKVNVLNAKQAKIVLKQKFRYSHAKTSKRKVHTTEITKTEKVERKADDLPSIEITYYGRDSIIVNQVNHVPDVGKKIKLE